MSSINSPTLALDVRARRGERMLVAVTLTAAVISPWALLQVEAANAALASVCFLIVTTAGLLRAGWIGGKRIVAVVWTADGRWLLRDARREERELILHRGVRLARRGVWLSFHPPGRSRPTCSILLTPADLAPGEFRRLSVRLRIQGLSTPMHDVVVAS